MGWKDQFTASRGNHISRQKKLIREKSVFLSVVWVINACSRRVWWAFHVEIITDGWIFSRTDAWVRRACSLVLLTLQCCVKLLQHHKHVGGHWRKGKYDNNLFLVVPWNRRQTGIWPHPPALGSDLKSTARGVLRQCPALQGVGPASRNSDFLMHHEPAYWSLSGAASQLNISKCRGIEKKNNRFEIISSNAVYPGFVCDGDVLNPGVSDRFRWQILWKEAQCRWSRRCQRGRVLPCSVCKRLNWNPICCKKIWSPTQAVLSRSFRSASGCRELYFWAFPD